MFSVARYFAAKQLDGKEEDGGITACSFSSERLVSTVFKQVSISPSLLSLLFWGKGFVHFLP